MEFCILIQKRGAIGPWPCDNKFVAKTKHNMDKSFLALFEKRQRELLPKRKRATAIEP